MREWNIAKGKEQFTGLYMTKQGKNSIKFWVYFNLPTWFSMQNWEILFWEAISRLFYDWKTKEIKGFLKMAQKLKGTFFRPNFSGLKVIFTF